MKRLLLPALAILLGTSGIYGQGDHRLLSTEKSLIPGYMHSRGINPGSTALPPPNSPVRTIAEWEELQALMVGWKSYPSILRQIVGAAKQQTKAIIVFESPETVASITSYLLSGGVDTTNVVFINQNLNSVWSRDYGPWSAYTSDVDSLVTIDWIYNRPRPEDDLVPVAISNYAGTPLYQTTTAPDQLVHTGGNFMTDGFGTGFSSKLVLDENGPGGGFGLSHSEQKVDSIMQAYMGISRYIKMDKLPYDVIHHIDMHMKLLDEQTLLVGQYPPGISDGPQIEANLQYVLSNFNSVFGTPYKVVRIPMPPDNGLYPSSGGDYFTYTNSSFINNSIIVPVYGIPQDNIALDIYRENLPGYNIIPINCLGMIGALGALHCITKEVGTSDPLLISHQPLENTTDTVIGYDVLGRIQHRSGIDTALVFWRTDTVSPWQSIIMAPMAMPDNYIALIPAQPAGTTVYYYIQAEANSGKTQKRPLPAPAGYWKFQVTGTTGNEDPKSLSDLLDAFPNPGRALTCVPVEMSSSGQALLTMRDAGGRLVQTLHNGSLSAGKHNFFFRADEMESGMYILELRTSDSRVFKKVMVQR
jgi:agmatine/peptidylarginine deiminase